MKRILAAAVLVLLGIIPLFAQDPQPTVTLSVGEIARRIQSGNLELFKAARSVERARDDLTGDPEWMESSVSVGGGYEGGGSRSGWYGQSTATIRLLPQLSASASVAVQEPGEFGESLSVTVNPFEPVRRTYSEERALGSAEVRERYLKRRLHLDAEQAAFALLIGDMERDLARRSEQLEQRNYELAQRRQELGEASFQDVQDQLLDVIKARQDLFSREQGYLGAWRNLQLLFAPSEDRIAVAPLPIEELLDLVARRGAEVGRYADAEPVTEELENLRLELAALEAELQATPTWRPEISLSTGVSLPYAYPDSHSVGVTMSFSPSQLKREQRRELQEDIEVKRMEIAAETSAASLQKSLELRNIALVEQALASARLQVERDAVALREAELLFEQGRRTTLELEQLRLNLQRARIQSYRSAVEVYRVLGVHLMLFAAENG
jgi:hypothetical protein